MNTPAFTFRALPALVMLAAASLSLSVQAQSSGETICASPSTMIADQGQGDAYLAGVPREWGWSHEGSAVSAIGGYDNWSDFEKQRNAQYAAYGGRWNRLMPWFVISGPSGSSTPSNVELGKMSVFYMTRSKQWRLLAANDPVEIGTCSAWSNLTDCRPTGTEPFATAHSPNPLHGWFRFINVPGDVQALSISIQARVVSGGPAMMTAGADYYPPEGVSTQGVAITAAGISAPRHLSHNWTTVTMTTLTDQTADASGISREELLAGNAPSCTHRFSR